MRTKCSAAFRCITSKRLVLFSVALLAIAITAVPAFAQNTCLQNEYNLAAGLSATSTAQSNALNCTANDVRIAAVSNVRDPITGNTLANCILGSTFNFIADFKVVTSSTSSRSNIGMFIATASTTQALTGSCDDNIIPPPSPFPPARNGLPAKFPCFTGSNIMCGTNFYDEFDASPDNCGDTSSSDNGGAPATQIVTLYIQNYSCTPPAGTNQLVLPNCTSWQIPGGTIQCVAPLAQQSYNLSAIPGTKSKCNCEVISLPVIAQTPSFVVQKECTTAITKGPAANSPGNPSAVPPVAPTQSPTACDSGVEGVDEVTYHVQITNQSNFGNITISSLTDSVYGNIGGASCPVAGCTADSTGCTLPAAGETIAAGSSFSCTFTAHKYGDPATATVTNHVSASGTSQFDGAIGPQNSNDVTVTPDEGPSAAKVTKTLNSLRAASITARFGVEVQNTSSSATCPTGGCDENETLTALSDSAFGHISPTPDPDIVATTCFTSTTNPSGVPLAAGTGDYTCTFDVTIPLTALTSVEEFGTGVCSGSTGSPGICTNPGGPTLVNGCTSNAQCDLFCLGLSHTNYITATINGDEGAADVVTPTRNTLNTNVCLTSFTQSQ